MKFFFIIFILISHFSFTQDAGFFGKKNVVSINGLGAIPLIQNFFNGPDSYSPYFKNKNGKLTPAKDLFNGGFSIGYSHAFTHNFGLGFDFVSFYSNTEGPVVGLYTEYIPDYGYDNYISVNLDHEALSIRTLTFLPKIEFQINSNELPIGIVNQFGIGYSTTKVIEKDYIYTITYPNPDNYNGLENKRVFDEKATYNGITIMYAFNVRTPISKSLLINYGIRYTLNYTFGGESISGIIPGSSANQSSNYLIDDVEMSNIIGKNRLANVISLNLGLSYLF